MATSTSPDTTRRHAALYPSARCVAARDDAIPPLTWAITDSGPGGMLIDAVSFDGATVQRAEYGYSREDGIEEIAGRINDEAYDELREALESRRHQYRGSTSDVDKAFSRATALVRQLEAEREERLADEAYRAEVLSDAEDRAWSGECGEVRA